MTQNNSCQSFWAKSVRVETRPRTNPCVGIESFTSKILVSLDSVTVPNPFFVTELFTVLDVLLGLKNSSSSSSKSAAVDLVRTGSASSGGIL